MQAGHLTLSTKMTEDVIETFKNEKGIGKNFYAPYECTFLRDIIF